MWVRNLEHEKKKKKKKKFKNQTMGKKNPFYEKTKTISKLNWISIKKFLKF